MAPTLKKSNPEPFPDNWASGHGKDEYGLWQSFAVDGVSCRMRWIWPGTFMMGSPENEPERSSDESQHEVTISQGFWLAETACTKALWQAVMGENPSRFKGEQRPVEQVSWEDCNRFIQAINEKKPGLDLRLPTEAEWEYACRAGTTTPFSFGGNITPEQVNYNGEYPYNNAEQGEKRGETVAVKSLPCNDLGLYEMHGNVWEWCNDWYGEYPSMPVIDPSGSETGSSRVLRGGRWFSYARLCRSAFRNLNDPDNRNVNFGFRLARGQKSLETGAYPTQEVAMDYTFHYGTLNRLASRTLDAVGAAASAERMNAPCFLLLVEEIDRLGIDPFDITLGTLSSLVELAHEKYNRNNRETANK